MTGSRPLLAFLAILILPATIRADWNSVTLLDAPLPRLSPDPAKAREAMARHLSLQITANENFLKENPGDPHAWESRVRLASANARLASLSADRAGVNRGIEELRKLEKTAPDEGLRAEAMFRRISLQWQDLGGTPDVRRENAAASARSFARSFPNDRRSARLLGEAAALSTSHPAEKSLLLEEAIALCTEEALMQRLQDDRKQLGLLGKPVDLAFTATDGTRVDLAARRGDVTAVVFWSPESAPSIVWLGYFAKFASGVPGLRVVTVSLGRSRTDLDAAMRSLGITWPTQFDGRGWENGVARKFGINTLPTLWLINRRGELVYLNARESYEHRINELLSKN